MRGAPIIFNPSHSSRIEPGAESAAPISALSAPLVSRSSCSFSPDRFQPSLGRLFLSRIVDSEPPTTARVGCCAQPKASFSAAPVRRRNLRAARAGPPARLGRPRTAPPVQARTGPLVGRDSEADWMGPTHPSPRLPPIPVAHPFGGHPSRVHSAQGPVTALRDRSRRSGTGHSAQGPVTALEASSSRAGVARRGRRRGGGCTRLGPLPGIGDLAASGQDLFSFLSTRLVSARQQLARRGGGCPRLAPACQQSRPRYLVTSLLRFRRRRLGRRPVQAVHERGRPDGANAGSGAIRREVRREVAADDARGSARCRAA